MARADVAVAFIARRQMTLPAPYLQTLVEHDQAGKWSFFAFKSCPVIFVLAMSQLSRLAGLYKRAASMGWTVFDEQTFVPELARIRRMVEDEQVDLARHESINIDMCKDSRQSQYHCIEAWRNAILLYTHRVFDRQSDSQTPASISYLANLVMDHVQWIPSSADIQKQVLLPVFLAGAEMRAPTSRKFVADYCSHWSKASRFGHFDTARDILQDLWQAMEADGKMWWGPHIESYPWSKPQEDCEDMVSEILLG